MEKPLFKAKWFWLLLILGIFVRIATAIFNYGYLALDDYYILFFSIPVQSASLSFIDPVSSVPEIRSLLPDLLIRCAAKVAYQLGFTDPLDQIRAVFVTLGIFSSITLFVGYRYLSFLFDSESKDARKSGYETWIPLTGLFLLSLHFLMPFVSTRALIESMSAPFLLSSAYYASRYWISGKDTDIAWSVLWCSVSALFRFQSGICVLPLAGMVIYKSIKHKNIRQSAVLIASGVFAFFLTGLPDLIFRGSFHSSLIAYLKYNLSHSSEYGTSPWFAYVPSVLGASLFPFLIGKYTDFRWKSTYSGLFPALSYALVFLFFHSCVPHKEERFLLPIFPILLVLAAPLFAYWWDKRKSVLDPRIVSFFVLNFLLLGFLSFFTIQNNVIGLVRYLNRNSDVQDVYVYKDSVPHLPVSYAYRSPLRTLEPVTEMDENHLPKIRNFDPYDACSTAFVVRKDYFLNGVDPEMPWRLEAEFASSPLEEFVVSLNPTKNGRRSSIYLFRFDDCGATVGRGKSRISGPIR